MNLKMFLNIMILTKCIILKYLAKIIKSLFHINVCSCNKNFDDLEHLLSCTKNNFHIVGVTQALRSRGGGRGGTCPVTPKILC